MGKTARLRSRAAPRAVAREGRGRALRDRSSRDRPRPALPTRTEARRPTRSRRARRRARGDRASRRISPLRLPSASAWVGVGARRGTRVANERDAARLYGAARREGERGTARGSERRALALGVWRGPHQTRRRETRNARREDKNRAPTIIQCSASLGIMLFRRIHTAQQVGKKCPKKTERHPPQVRGSWWNTTWRGRHRDEFTPPKRHGSVRIDASRRRGPRATARVRRRETTRAPCPAFGARAGSAPRDGNFAGGESRSRRALRHRFRGTGGFARQEARP